MPRRRDPFAIVPKPGQRRKSSRFLHDVGNFPVALMSSIPMRTEVTIAVSMALGLGVALALLVDLSGPKGAAGQAKAAASLLPSDDLASRMEAQIAAGAPGVALAIDEQAGPNHKRGAAVAAARARAHYELGDAPKALETTKTALRICDVSSTCSPAERATLGRLDTVFSAVVSAGVVDPKRDPAATGAAIEGLVHRASFVR